MKGQLLFRGALMLAAALTVSVSVLSSREVVHAQTAEPTPAMETVVYSEVGGEKLQVDVYQPPVRKLPRPAVLLFHPGSAITGTRDIMTDQAQGLAEAGYVAFNADYRLLQPDNTNRWPAQLDDAQLLVRWVRANADRYHVDPNRICALGYSFGGQLAELLGERDTAKDSALPLASYSSHVTCVVAIAGISDATQPYTTDATLQSALVRLMSGTVGDVPERYQDASPITQIGTHTAPFLIFQGTSDQFIPVQETMRMVDALQTAGIEVVYVEIPLVDHYYWSDWSTEKPETLAFLERHLHPAS